MNNNASQVTGNLPPTTRKTHYLQHVNWDKFEGLQFHSCDVTLVPVKQILRTNIHIIQQYECSVLVFTFVSTMFIDVEGVFISGQQGQESVSFYVILKFVNVKW